MISILIIIILSSRFDQPQQQEWAAKEALAVSAFRWFCCPHSTTKNKRRPQVKYLSRFDLLVGLLHPILTECMLAYGSVNPLAGN